MLTVPSDLLTIVVVVFLHGFCWCANRERLCTAIITMLDIDHFRGTFGDYGNMEGLYHIEPLERISSEVRNMSNNLVTST